MPPWLQFLLASPLPPQLRSLLLRWRPLFYDCLGVPWWIRMSSLVACSASWTSTLATASRFSIAAGGPSGFPYTSTAVGALSPVARPSPWPSCVGWCRGSRSWDMDRSAEPWRGWMHATTRKTGRRMAVVEWGMGAEEEVECCRPVLRARSEEELISYIRNEVESGRLKSDIAARLEELYYSYRNAVMQSENPSAREIVLSNMAGAFDRIILDVEDPFNFPPYHKSIREPFDYYMFGQNYIRPLVDFRASYVGNISAFFDIEEKLKQGHNVVMFSNHQTEADPAIIALLLERTNPYIAESMVFVAGDRVVTDPLCKPFSMGRNLICVYSKKHMNDIPELVEMKRKANTRSLKEMAMLLRGGSQLIWIAPSGGRDRSDPLTGKWHPSPFDASSVDNMRRLVEHCDVPGHIYPLALQCYEVMPPPEEVEKEIGERRKIAFHGVGLSVAPEMNFYETTSGCMDPEESKEVFSQALYDIVTEQYNVLNSAIYGCQGISASNSIISLSQPWI